METKKFTPLHNFMDLLLDAICVVDAEGRFVFVSAAGECIFGYTPDCFDAGCNSESPA